MVCENCGIELEMFDRICSYCGSKVEYAPITMWPKIPYSSTTETPVEEKIPTSFETKKNSDKSKFLKIFMAKNKIVSGGMK